jgi:hypothetical protein
MISREARSRIRKHGKTTRRIRQRGVPFDVPIGVPVVNPFVEKQMRFKAQFTLSGVSLEDVREGLLFADYSGFMDMKVETFNRKARTRHFKINPFTKKMEEVLGRPFGRWGVRTGHAERGQSPAPTTSSHSQSGGWANRL